MKDHKLSIKIPLLLCILAGLSACTTTEIDQFRQADTQINSDESIVILGRRHSNSYETELDFVECVGNVVASGNDGINVIPESVFLDEMFPFFEPRTAPMRTDHLEQLMQQDVAAEKLEDFGVEYIVWVDGLTQRSGESGSISCAVGPGGGGCLVLVPGLMIQTLKRKSGTWILYPVPAPSVLMLMDSPIYQPLFYQSRY